MMLDWNEYQRQLLATVGEKYSLLAEGE